jgi:IS605 OrfB family transposase
VKVTRIIYSKKLNDGKFNALNEQAKRLGNLRSEIWQRFGSINGVGKSDREIRDAWLEEGRQFDLPANAWKETLRDTISDIKASMEAAKVKARKAIFRHTKNDTDENGQKDSTERKRLYILLKFDKWTTDPYLTRIMRKYWKRGHNHTHNQIIVRSDNYTAFSLGDQAWIKIPGLEPRKMVAIPLNTSFFPEGTLRLILRDGRVEVHYQLGIKTEDRHGDKILGVDKGYTEVLVDSEKEHHGTGLGKILSAESDFLKTKHQRRNKLRKIAEKKPHKKINIERNNLGRKKLNQRDKATRARVRDEVFQAVHKVVDKASVIVAEDLTSPISSSKKKSYGRNMNRRLSAWTKGVIAEALSSVSQRRSSTLALVSACYTSQVDSRNGCLMGKRRGVRFYCFDGVVLDANENAAGNVKARFYDSEIELWTPYREVRSILLRRTESHRLGLLNLDSSCGSLDSSTESESLFTKGQLCPT